MKRLLVLSGLAVAITQVSGCGYLWGKEGYFRDRGDDYLEARQTAPMQIPSGVSNKPLDPLLPIPANVADLSARSDLDVPRPQELSSAAEASDFSVQGSGDNRWLMAQQAPAQVWPVALQFLLDNGFNVAEERPQTGELITSWQRLDELTIASRLRAEMPENTESRLRVRIEPGVQRGTSEIYLTSVSRPVGSQQDVAFPAVGAAGSGLQVALLQQLQAGLTRSAEQGGSVSLLAARDFDAPSRVALSQDGNGNPVLNLSTDLDRAWSAVGRALDQADVRVDDLNRSLGVYYVDLSQGARSAERKPGFFSRLFGLAPSKAELEAKAERYQLRLTEYAGGVQISVEKNIDTLAPEDVSRRVLGMLRDHLG